jgi:hypothetical protein
MPTKEAQMSRIPAWLYLLFGALAVVSGVLGIGHAPSGIPKMFWAVITIAGAASLTTAAFITRHQRRQLK